MATLLQGKEPRRQAFVITHDVITMPLSVVTRSNLAREVRTFWEEHSHLLLWVCGQFASPTLSEFGTGSLLFSIQLCRYSGGVKHVHELLNLRAYETSMLYQNYIHFNVWIRYYVRNFKGRSIERSRLYWGECCRTPMCFCPGPSVPPEPL